MWYIVFIILIIFSSEAIELKKYNSLDYECDQLRIYKNNTVIAYFSKDDKNYIQINETIYGPCDYESGVVVSKNNSSYGFNCISDKAAYYIINQKRYGPYNPIYIHDYECPILSDNGITFAFKYQDENGWHMRINNIDIMLRDSYPEYITITSKGDKVAFRFSNYVCIVNLTNFPTDKTYSIDFQDMSLSWTGNFLYYKIDTDIKIAENFKFFVFDSIYDIIPSIDKSSFAIITGENQGRRLIVFDEANVLYPTESFEFFAYNNTPSFQAIAIKTNTSCTLNINGVIFENVLDSFIYNLYADKKFNHYVFAFKKYGNKNMKTVNTYVIYDYKIYGVYEKIGNLELSDDGLNIAFSYKKDNKEFIYFKNKPIQIYGLIKMEINNDFSRLAYIYKKDDKLNLFYNEKYYDVTYIKNNYDIIFNDNNSLILSYIEDGYIKINKFD